MLLYEVCSFFVMRVVNGLLHYCCPTSFTYGDAY